MGQQKVAIIGSGNWGSAIATLLGPNVRKNDAFDPEIRMWVFEEEVDGKKLTEIINEKHENVKYLPGVKLPDNVKAVPELKDAVKGATWLVFVLPGQFVVKTCDQLAGSLEPNAKAVSLVKGLDVENGHLHLMSRLIAEKLKIDCCAMMGANIANEVAREAFCESTIGYENKENAETWKSLLQTSQFRISIVPDIAGVELCGALKNIVGVAAGLVDGLTDCQNTKAAVMRIGLVSIMKFAESFYQRVEDRTFFQSCGMADLVATCYGGRNRKVAEAFVKTGKSFDELEKEMLNGQKVQGVPAAKSVYDVLKRKDRLKDFPFFVTVYRICFEGLDPKEIINPQAIEVELK
ncbi:hypothetical protein HDU85_006041 [Gaertneriomyces sp. JEL0708]|nr:hypothetical protein HDU85_006041 [Gaertneriomyces sp. JEL0708]